MQTQSVMDEVREHLFESLQEIANTNRQSTAHHVLATQIGKSFDAVFAKQQRVLHGNLEAEFDHLQGVLHDELDKIMEELREA